MATKRTCVLVCTIGDEGTVERQEAEGLTWVAKRALENLGFEVKRIDEISPVAEITKTIVDMVLAADLCLIAISDKNPNLMYYAGRRHQSGKVFLQLIRRGDSTPGALRDYKAIYYDDLNSRVSLDRAMTEIQNFVRDATNEIGLSEPNSTVSLKAISERLEQIERKLNQILTGPALNTINIEASTPNDPAATFTTMFENPREAFVTAIANGDVNRAGKLLPKLRQILGPTPELVAAAAILAAAGHEPAVNQVLELFADDIERFGSPDDQVIKGAVGSVVRFYESSDRESDGLERIGPIIDQLVALPSIDNSTKAYYLNQKSKLLYGTSEYGQALDIAEEVLRLKPTEVSYLYNASLIYKKLNLHTRAVAMADRIMDMNTEDADHLTFVVQVYFEANQIDKARQAFNKLRQVSPAKANILLLDPKIRRLMGE